MDPKNNIAARQFPTTRWSVVSAARTQNQERRCAALEAFLKTYYEVLQDYVKRQFNVSEDTARDYVHGFISQRMIQKNLMAQADQTRGKFRNFLVRSLNHFVIDELRKANAAKNAPDQGMISISELDEESLESLHASAQVVFDLRFAQGVVVQSLKRMQDRCEATNRIDLWKVFHERVLSAAFEGNKPVPYEQLTPLLGLASEAQAANLLTTAKRMFTRVFRSVVRDYEADDASVEEEIRALRHLLSNA